MAGNAEQELRSIWDAAIAAVDPLNIPPQVFPPRPNGRLVVAGAGQGGGAHGSRRRTALRRAARRADRHGLWLRATGAVAQGHFRRTSAPGCGGAGGGKPNSRSRAIAWARRSASGAPLRRRVGSSSAAGRGRFVGRQARDDTRAARFRRSDFGDECRAQASVPHQGRAVGGGGVAGAHGDAGDLRRSR